MKKIKIFILEDDYIWIKTLISILNKQIPPHLKEGVELDITVVGPLDKDERIPGMELFKQANELLTEPNKYDFVILDYNIGNDGTLPDTENLYTDSLIYELAFSGVPFRIFTGSGLSFEKFLNISKEKGIDLSANVWEKGAGYDREKFAKEILEVVNKGGPQLPESEHIKF